MIKPNTKNSARLIRLRKNWGLSQRGLAKEFRVSPWAIGFWESGGRVIPGPILKLMDAFEHHLLSVSPADSDVSPNLSTTKLQLEKICVEWADKLMTSFPMKKKSKKGASTSCYFENYFLSLLINHLSADPIKKCVQIANYSRLIGQLNNQNDRKLEVLFSSATARCFDIEMKLCDSADSNSYPKPLFPLITSRHRW